MRSHAFIHDSR